ncbi:hypothetical protein SLS56_007355 [Neofusicoccum ribis]|uniref:Alpha/beta hydrolase fold-3 domain-containing protein n=1 Tax=Neofusicoccum ribis TaxID=45134 RepID=A0ABR3SP17_9PEZI
MWLFTYLRLKATVSLMRFLMWLRRGSPATHQTSTLHIPSREPGRTIKAHVYQPPSASTSRPPPVLLNFHGSGFVLPMHGSDDEFCTLIARTTGHVVLDIQYRLAPEHPFPAAVHDAEDAIRWALDNPSYDSARVSLSGFSAGANLALVAAAALAFPPAAFRALLAFYPPADLSVPPAAKRAPDPAGRPIPPAMARLFDACYIPPGVDPRDPRISPCYADPERFPEEVVVLTGAQDSLAEEAERLAGRVEGAGRSRVVRRRFEGCGHAWDKGAVEGSVQAKAKAEAYGMAVEALKRWCGRTGEVPRCP